MTFSSLIEQLNYRLVDRRQRPLNTAEALVLEGIWEGRTYGQIAKTHGYSAAYFTNVVAPDLCRKLSELVGRAVTKKTCRPLVELYLASITPPGTLAGPPEPTSVYPDGAIPPDSPYRVERSPYEERVARELEKAGALVRIKAPSEMGKTTLLLRALKIAREWGFQTVYLDLAQVDLDIFNNINRFLRWLSVNVSRQLQLEPKLDEYWDEDMGSKASCNFYFEACILDSLAAPLVLALDGVDHLFEYSHLVRDFLPLLRSWYEQTRFHPLWQKLRQVVVHSTDIYVPLQLSQSPFNVGLPIQLSHFRSKQVEDLADRYGLTWEREDTEGLMALVGGHPALVHQALYHLSQENIDRAELLDDLHLHAATAIYRDHLQRHWSVLQARPALAEAFRWTIASDVPVVLEPTVAYQLSGTGLIRLAEDDAHPGQSRFIPGCDLYRRYFRAYLE